MNSINFIIKTQNNNIIKFFMELNLGPVSQEIINHQNNLYVIDWDPIINNPQWITDLKWPYIILLDMKDMDQWNNLPWTVYGKGYFLKPLDKYWVPVKLQFINHMELDSSPIIPKDSIKNIFINKIIHHKNAINSYYNIHPLNLLKIKNHNLSLDLISNYLLIDENNYYTMFNKAQDLWRFLSLKGDLIWIDYHELSVKYYYYFIYGIINYSTQWNDKSFIQYLNYDYPIIYFISNYNLAELLPYDNWLINENNQQWSINININ